MGLRCYVLQMQHPESNWIKPFSAIHTGTTNEVHKLLISSLINMISTETKWESCILSLEVLSVLRQKKRLPLMLHLTCFCYCCHHQSDGI